MSHMFAEFSQDPNGIQYSFKTEQDYDNIESMRFWLDENSLEEYVIEDEGTLVILQDPSTNAEYVVESYGEGDFFSHGISVVYRTEY